MYPAVMAVKQRFEWNILEVETIPSRKCATREIDHESKVFRTSSFSNTTNYVTAQ